jgi:hypothetical protein
MNQIQKCFIGFFLVCGLSQAKAQNFKAIAFYTGREDQAHISFMHEAHRFFSKLARENNFTYDSTKDWSNMNDEFLSRYQVVILLDLRPETKENSDAFQKFMEKLPKLSSSFETNPLLPPVIKTVFIITSRYCVFRIHRHKML